MPLFTILLIQFMPKVQKIYNLARMQFKYIIYYRNSIQNSIYTRLGFYLSIQIAAKTKRNGMVVSMAGGVGGWGGGRCAGDRRDPG